MCSMITWVLRPWSLHTYHLIVCVFIDFMYDVNDSSFTYYVYMLYAIVYHWADEGDILLRLN